MLQPPIEPRGNLSGRVIRMLATDQLALEDDPGSPQVNRCLKPLDENPFVAHGGSVTTVRSAPGARFPGVRRPRGAP
jgi:hypothetical protein